MTWLCEEGRNRGPIESCLNASTHPHPNLPPSREKEFPWKGADTLRPLYTPCRSNQPNALYNIYTASAYNMYANTFFSDFTGRLCAVLAPSGAVMKLAIEMTSNAGR
jgi:hypothetical protein